MVEFIQAILSFGSVLLGFIQGYERVMYPNPPGSMSSSRQSLVRSIGFLWIALAFVWFSLAGLISGISSAWKILSLAVFLLIIVGLITTYLYHKLRTDNYFPSTKEEFLRPKQYKYEEEFNPYKPIYVMEPLIGKWWNSTVLLRELRKSYIGSNVKINSGESGTVTDVTLHSPLKEGEEGEILLQVRQEDGKYLVVSHTLIIK